MDGPVVFTVSAPGAEGTDHEADPSLLVGYTSYHCLSATCYGTARRLGQKVSTLALRRHRRSTPAPKLRTGHGSRSCDHTSLAGCP